MISQHCEAPKFSTLLTLSIIDNPQVNSNTNVSMPCMTQFENNFNPLLETMTGEIKVFEAVEGCYVDIKLTNEYHIVAQQLKRN